ncbi:MAG TPA: glycoside hydrolase family 99-like domain-containing protein [Opitutaceae bacterium]
MLQPAMLGSYFSEEAMLRRLGVKALRAPADVEVVAYNFPSWHPSPYMEGLFGKGWTEFETLKDSRALFPGHLFPKYPLWGYFDESNPEWAAREIDAAAGHGLTAWMIDWYWHDGVQFYHEQLEKGFLNAHNRARLKFAIMWANHDWKNVYPAKSPGEAAVLLPQTHSLEDFRRVTRYYIDHYFHQPNYWRIDGALVFGIFDLGKVIQYLGEDGTKRALEEMRAAVRKAGLGELHIQSNNGHGGVENRLRELGIDSATIYHTFAWTYQGGPGTAGTYGQGAAKSIDTWESQKRLCNVQTFPDCPVGFDDSPRFGTGSHMAVGRSPDQFERLVRAARHFVADDKTKVIYVSAWNEWTEDHVLLPDSIWGYSYLEALMRAASS